MKIPSYKIVKILSSNKLDIDAQLKSMEFGSQAFALDLFHAEDTQKAIDIIETYFDEQSVPLLPYPTILITKENADSDLLDIYPGLEYAPRFYRQKSKTPNVKEQAVITRLELKQKNFESLRTLNYESVFKKYGISHKIISDLAKEAYFYEQLIFKLKEQKDGQ